MLTSQEENYILTHAYVPSRRHSVIDRRDRIFYERMSEYLKQGDAVVFVEAPHVRGMSKLLREDGYQITGPGI
jgi:uncharacterized protein YbaP (TraB family)